MSNGGRPKLDPENCRKHSIIVRMNDEEYEKLKFICDYDGDGTASSVVRKLINKKHHDIWEAIKYEFVAK